MGHRGNRMGRGSDVGDPEHENRRMKERALERRIFPMRSFYRAIRATIGFTLLLVGAIGVMVCLVAVVDPVGTKMADDNDPFGNPPSRISSFAWAIGFGVVGACGLPLLAGKSNPDK